MITNKQNRRGQTGEAGPLQGIMIALLIVSAAGFAMFSFYNGMSNGYDQTPAFQDKNTFTTYQDLSDNTSNFVGDLQGSVAGEDNTSGGATDIILEMTNRGFRVLTDILFSPIRIANSVIQDSADALGVPIYLRSIFKTIIEIIVILAIIALIMKVRA